MILERVTGMSVSNYLQDKLWKPLGMQYPASWSLDSKLDGFEKMASGLNARAIDYARFGQLMLNGGMWNGLPTHPPGLGRGIHFTGRIGPAAVDGFRGVQGIRRLLQIPLVGPASDPTVIMIISPTVRTDNTSTFAPPITLSSCGTAAPKVRWMTGRQYSGNSKTNWRRPKIEPCDRIPILFEDDALLVIDKPAGVLSLPDGYDRSLPHLATILEAASRAAVAGAPARPRHERRAGAGAQRGRPPRPERPVPRAAR